MTHDITYYRLSSICNAYRDQLSKDKKVYFLYTKWIYYDEMNKVKVLRDATPSECKLFLFLRKLLEG